MLLAGPPGSGFTALLEEVAEAAAGSAEGWLVLSARAARDEAALPHALLHQVLHPLLDELGGELDEARRGALEAAVGARAPDEGRVPLAMAVLGALESVARRRPVLVAVDDAQWCDPGSAAVLRFLGRRLARTAVCLVVVLPDQDGAAGAETSAGERAEEAGTDDVVALAPLDDADALRLVDADQPSLDPASRTQLVALAAGRPRRLVDLLRLTGSGRGAVPPGAGHRPSLQGAALPSVAAAHRALAEVPEVVRRELVVRGLLDDPVGAPLVTVVAGTGRTPALRRHPAPRSTPDPFLAALAAEEADPAEVVELRAAWALRLEEAAATAAPGPSRRMAAEALRQRVLAAPATAVVAPLTAPLEAAARALRGVDAQRSGELSALAAELLLDDADGGAAAAALHRAAETASACGRVQRAQELSARADAATAGLAGAGAAAARGVQERGRALAALARGDRATAEQHLQRAVEHLALAATAAAAAGAGAGDQAAAEELLATATALVVVAGRRAQPLTGLDAALEALPAEASDRLRAVSALCAPWDGTAPDEQQRALSTALRVLSGAGLPVLRPVADAGRLLGCSQQVARLCRSLVGAWPATGPAAVDLQLALVASALELSGVPEASEHVLRARSALRHAPEAAAAVEQAEVLLQCLGSGQVPDAAEEVAPDLPASSERAGAVWCRAHHHRLRGDLAAAAAELLPLWPRRGEPADAGALLQALPTAHALSGSGLDPEALQQVVQQVCAWASGSGSPLAVSTALTVRAVVSADPAEQRRLLEEAAAAAGDGSGAAAPLLALGMLLRRSRKGVIARGPLGAALGLFEEQGHTAFAELARRELDATAPQRPARPMGSAVLTGQERTVAALAAKGLANADIARSLGISARTVAHHLQHVYAKLGVPGRHHLRKRLESA